MKTVSWGVLLAAGLFVAVSAEAQNKAGPTAPKVYRWVDENGEVHFSESLPPDFQVEKNELQKKTGNSWSKDQTLVPPPPAKPKPPAKNELPRDSSGLKRPAPRYTPVQLKAQQDFLLLLRYDTEQDLIDAMQVEIKQLDYDKRVLTTSKSSLVEAYRGNIREAAERQRAGIKVEDKLATDIRSLKQRLATNQISLSGLKAREESISKMFDEELARYRTLVAARAKAEN